MGSHVPFRAYPKDFLYNLYQSFNESLNGRLMIGKTVVGFFSLQEETTMKAKTKRTVLWIITLWAVIMGCTVTDWFFCPWTAVFEQTDSLN
jgi:hypothetical protein